MGYDFVILGAGVYGSGTAWELARRGEDVLVLEADPTPEGASTGLGKRGIRANGRDRRELPLMREAYDIWPELEELTGKRTGYERTGHVRLVERDSDGLHGGRVGLDARKWLQEKNGVPTHVLDREEVQELEPNVSDDVIAGLYCPNDGVADHTATTRGLAEAAEEHGAELRYDTPVTGVKRDGSTVTGVVTEAGEEIAVNDTLLVFTNLHAVQFVEEQFGLDLPVWRTLPQVMVTESLPEVPVRHLIGHDHRKLAIKEVSHDRVMISGGYTGKWDQDREKGTEILDHVADNFEDAAAVFPALAEANISDVAAGRPESVSVDGIPIIDTVPSTENVIVGTGWSGHGYAISVAVNRLVADWVRGGTKPELLEPFTYERFHEPVA